MIDARFITIPIGEDGAVLAGDLVVPADASALVVFAHGSGSGRCSPRNRAVADSLHRADLATLLIDLLTVDEAAADERTGHLRFDIDLLAERLELATRWLADDPTTAAMRIGYFGASTGAGAALVAAARQGDRVAAVVSRGGRPDLARDHLARATAPTLLIVGSLDISILDLNRRVIDHLHGERRLEVVPGAGHLFEEHGTMEVVANLARHWFRCHMTDEVPLN